MTIKIEELRSFVSVAEEGSFSGAARRLRRAQSVVSTHVAGIEAELGFALFIREPAPIVTPAACELLPIARRVLAESARFESRAAALFDLPEPVLYIGIDMGLEVPLILDLVKDFSKAFPAAKLQIENISSSETTWFFRKSSMKMALVFSSRIDTECDECVIGHAPQCIAVSKKHPLAQSLSLSAKELKTSRQIVISARDSESSPPFIVSDDYWEVDNARWALGLAARGIGWTVVPRSLVMSQATFRNQLVLLPSPFDLPAERLVLRSKKDEVSSAFLQWWQKAAKKCAEKLGLKVTP